MTKFEPQITAAIDNKQYNNMQEGEQYHSIRLDINSQPAQFILYYVISTTAIIDPFNGTRNK